MQTRDNVAIYPKNNSADGPPRVTRAPAATLTISAQDQAGDVIIPNAFDGVEVYAPPFSGSGCGTLLGTITDSYGQASDAAALNAATGTIVVGNITGGSADGIVTCTLAKSHLPPALLPGPD